TCYIQNFVDLSGFGMQLKNALKGMMPHFEGQKIAEDFMTAQNLGVPLEQTETTQVEGTVMGQTLTIKNVEKLKTISIKKVEKAPYLLAIPPGYEVKEMAVAKGLPSVPAAPSAPSIPKSPF